MCRVILVLPRRCWRARTGGCLRWACSGLARGRPLGGVEAGMSITKRMLAPAPSGEPCHFLVQWDMARPALTTRHTRSRITRMTIRTLAAMASGR